MDQVTPGRNDGGGGDDERPRFCRRRFRPEQA